MKAVQMNQSNPRGEASRPTRAKCPKCDASITIPGDITIKMRDTGAELQKIECLGCGATMNLRVTRVPGV